MSFGFRLESFSPGEAPPPAERFTREEIEAARAEGMAAGRAAQQAEDRTEVEAALQALADMREIQRAALQTAREDALHDLAPVVSAALALLAPAGRDALIEHALMAEISRLTESSPDLCFTIRCDTGVAKRLNAAMPASGMVIAPSPRGEVEVIADGGRISIDPARLSEAVAGLIAEYFQKEPNT